MADLFDTTLVPTKIELIEAWIGRQRWYTAKGRTPRLTRLDGYRLDDPAGEVGIETHIVLDDAGAEPVIYQVPLTYRGAPLEGAEHALVGELEHGVLGHRWVYDAPHDPVYARELLRLCQGRVQAQHATRSRTAEPRVEGLSVPGAPLAHVRSSRVLSGEQSNTSIVYETTASAGTPPYVVCKVFRMLQPGANPDVVLQGALSEAGSARVPASLGAVEGSWAENPDGIEPDVDGHLAFAQEFLADGVDGWRTALEAAREDRDFTREARGLGLATAEVHAVLADVLDTQEADETERADLRNQWRTRRAAAVAEVPDLVRHSRAIETVFDTAARAPWPRLQRIHGDYHLGQVLDVPGRGWVLLDFEGEPLRPLPERSVPDLTLRDLAGMLRSFDYAASTVALEASGPDAQARVARAHAWARAAREAFLDGYAQAETDPREDEDTLAVLAALELDKALYEVVYEARNRPTWVGIPTAAIARLVAADPPHASTPAPAPASAPSQERTDPALSSTSTPAPRPVEPGALDLLAKGGHGDPHLVLGAHPHGGGTTFRALRPLADRVAVELPDGSRHPMEHEHGGVWVLHLEDAAPSDYRLLVAYAGGEEQRQDDPYRFWPTLGDMDLHLIGEGRHEELWKVLGSHVRTYPGAMGEVTGTSFAVWAPNARAIRVIGEFNRWDGQAHPMRALGSSGVWELFVPGVGENTPYKYEILGADGYWRPKADPLARATQCPPETASVVTASHYEWDDAAWMERRAALANPQDAPMSVYEVHLGSWRVGCSYTDLAEQLVDYVTELGFTHVEFLPVMEHPYGPSWGYQVTGYYAPTSRFGSPDEFRYLVDRLHQAGIGVILDWVPGHFPKDAFALGRFDGQALYEHPDPRRGDQPDWGTYVFDFGRPQVRNFLVANANYWIEEFHVDGLRVDAVASMLYLDYSRNEGEWLPNRYGGREHLEAVQLLQETNATVYRRYPGAVTIAEESTSWPGITSPTYSGGLGFGLKWNMGWMHDSLEYVAQPPVYRQYHHHQMTFSMVYAYSEKFVLPISHDEVVHGKGSLLRKMPGDRWEQLAGMRGFYAYMWSHPGKQLLFMGQEFAQEAEWADARSLDWWLLDHEPHRGMSGLVGDLNRLYASHPALWQLDNDPAGFQWIDANDAAGNTFSFLRYGLPGETGERPVLASIVNFSGAEHHEYRVGLPHPGPWREILNTDSADYGGGGVGNLGQVVAEEVPWHGQPCSALVTLPRLGAVWFEPAGGAAPAPGASARAAQGLGVERPELSGAPVREDEAVPSELTAEELAQPRVGASGGTVAAPDPEEE